MISWDHVYGISRIKLISVTCSPSLLYSHFLLEDFQRKMRICLESGKMVWMSNPEQGIQQKTTQPEPARPDYFHWSITGHCDLQSTRSEGGPARLLQPWRWKWSRVTAQPSSQFTQQWPSPSWGSRSSEDNASHILEIQLPHMYLHLGWLQKDLINFQSENGAEEIKANPSRFHRKAK